MTLVSGAFPMKGDYTLVWSKTPIGDETECIVVAEGKLDKLTTKLTFSFIIPEASYGTNYIQFRRAARPEDSYGFIFSVLPDIKVSPSPVSPGSTVTVNGTGFTADDYIDLSLDSNAIDMDIEANELGSFTAEFTIPDAIAGNHNFEAAAKSTFLVKATASFEVVPRISLEPELPEIGSEVTVTGCGFAASSDISVKYDGIMMANSPQTDALGNFTYTFNVPQTSEAEHEIVVTDGAGNTATWGLPLEGTAPEAPSTISPRGQRFGLFGSQVVAFTWTDVDDPSGVTYTLEIADNLNFFPLAAGMRKTDLTQPACIATLDPGTYYWRVKAIDGAGNEGQWTLSPYPFKVGLFSAAYLIIGGIICVLIFLLIIRAFFRRIKEFY